LRRKPHNDGPVRVNTTSDKLVTVRTFQILTEAEMARMLLEGEGVRAFLLDAGIVNFNWFLSNAVGYIKLQVPEAEVQQAMELLQRIPEHRPGVSRASDEELVEENVCLACGGPMSEQETKCPACGWSFESMEPEDA
jgi:rubrerythrin